MTTAGIKALRKVQLGRESTAGDAVAATTIWRGPAIMPVDDQVKIMPDENIGVSSKIARQYTPMYIANMEFLETEATFEQLPHLFEAGLQTASATQDGVGSGYTYTYNIPSGDAGTLKHYTIEGGDNKTVEEMEYSFVKEINLSGKIGESWMVSASWQGRQSTVSSFTGALSAPAVDEILFQKTKLYIDDSTGTIGTTQIVNSLIGASLKISTGWKAQHTGDGNLYFSYPEFTGASGQLELTLLHNATTAAERVKWRSDTPRQIKLIALGDALTTPGVFSNKTLDIRLAGIYTQFSPPNDESEGSNVYKVTFELAYDSTAALLGQILVTNELSSLP